VLGHAVMGEQGVQERVGNAPLWGPSVEDQQLRISVSYSHHLLAADQGVQDPVAQDGSRLRVSDLMTSLECTMVLNAEL
jgi:hypothetical protein